MTDGENFSSSDFVARVRRGDRSAFESLVKAYNRQLFRTAFGLGLDENGAAELVQNTWATFFSVAEKFEGRAHIRTFIFGILYNKTSEHWRDKYKQNAHDDFDDHMESRFDNTGHWYKPPSTPEDVYLQKETLELIEECLKRVPEAQRTAFHMKEVEGEPTESICNILGVSVTNLGVMIYRAKNRLRECLEGKLEAGR